MNAFAPSERAAANSKYGLIFPAIFQHISLSLSDMYTHTHTHTHSLSLVCARARARTLFLWILMLLQLITSSSRVEEHILHFQKTFIPANCLSSSLPLFLFFEEEVNAYSKNRVPKHTIYFSVKFTVQSTSSWENANHHSKTWSVQVKSHLLNCLVGLVEKTSSSRMEAAGFEFHLCWDFSRSSYTSDLKIGTPVATLPQPWRSRVCAGTGWPSVSILWLGEMASLIRNFNLSMAAWKIVWTDLSLRYTSILLGHQASNQPTNKLSNSGSVLWRTRRRFCFMEYTTSICKI